jgi:quinol-cytochrome oxidoreductase complex cytochrome b subunit
MSDSRIDRTESQTGYFRRIWLSMFPAPLPPRSERERTRFLLRNLILHFRPTLVPERTLRFSLTFGLGGMAVVLVLLQLFTGVLLKFVYEPFPSLAYESLVHLQGTFLFGPLIRNIHFWTANFLILVVFLHGLRVLFTGAFHAPRQMNWVIGLTLFLLVLASNLTGYLLPWDQLAYWATTICVGMLEYIPLIGTWLQRAILGGNQMGPPTLQNFYAFHTAVIPALILTLMAFHFWRVRKAGGLVIPRSPGEDLLDKPVTVSTVPHLLVREVTVALCLVAFVIGFSVVFDAPMGPPANPGFSPNPTKAPWYFAGVQEMLMHFHPSFALLIVFGALIYAFFVLPYAYYPLATRGIWFGSITGRRTSLISLCAGALCSVLVVVLDEYVIDLVSWMPGLSQIVTNGVIPMALMISALGGYYFLLKRGFGLSRIEATQALIVFVVVSFVIMTVTCYLFRGQGMRLTWPF